MRSMSEKKAWKEVADRLRDSPDYTLGICTVLYMLEIEGYISYKLHRQMSEPLYARARKRGKRPTFDYLWPLNRHGRRQRIRWCQAKARGGR